MRCAERGRRANSWQPDGREHAADTAQAVPADVTPRGSEWRYISSAIACKPQANTEAAGNPTPPRPNTHQSKRLMKPFHVVSIGSVIASVALLVAGFEGMAGFAFVFSTVVELVGSVVTGKQGNDTER